jgi:hypothetical protein
LKSTEIEIGICIDLHAIGCNWLMIFPKKSLMKDSKQNINWNQTLLNEMEIWSSMKIFRKYDRGHKLMVQYSQMLVTINSFIALFLH